MYSLKVQLSFANKFYPTLKVMTNLHWCTEILRDAIFLINADSKFAQTRTYRFRNRWSSLSFINSRADDANVPLHRYYCAILWPRFATCWFTLCSGRTIVVETVLYRKKYEVVTAISENYINQTCDAIREMLKFLLK